jgi:hypothetical protein
MKPIVTVAAVLLSSLTLAPLPVAKSASSSFCVPCAGARTQSPCPRTERLRMVGRAVAASVCAAAKRFQLLLIDTDIYEKLMSVGQLWG